MSQRPPKGVDPDATVALPSSAPDPDATVAMPSLPRQPDPDATVAMPSTSRPAVDPDATVAMPSREPDPDATVAIPTPGRRREADAPAIERAAAPADVASLGGLNPLVAAANPILAVVPQIRGTLRHPDPAALRAQLRDQLAAFDAAGRAASINPEHVEAAHYTLCALLDESASRTPWGSGWSRDGLLAELHGEHEPGDKIFRMIAAASDSPAANADLIEFFHVCLALGLEGGQRGGEEGRRVLDAERSKTHALIRAVRPAPESDLSERWRGVVMRPPRVPGAIMLWAVVSGVALALGALYLGFSISLGSRSDPVAREMARLKAPAPERLQRAAPAAPAAGPTVEELLADEVKRGLVAVQSDAERSSIVLRSDRLFGSGSARVDAGIEPVLLRIAAALDKAPGVIVVTGHSDDVPIRTARFPSNWELSTERARSVMALIQGRLRDPSRLRAEGLADSAPLAPNDSDANRARNRRVELVLRRAP